MCDDRASPGPDERRAGRGHSAVPVARSRGAGVARINALVVRVGAERQEVLP